MATLAREQTAAREAWRLLMDLAFANKSRFVEAMGAFDLTPVQGHVLRILQPGEPMPMNDLAGALRCDASNVTGLVDRLEQRGLLERRPGARDRRVKELLLTPSGLDVRERVLERMSEPPEAITQLSARDQRLLRDVLRRALGREA
jgi:MarR family transcriptional regulator, organic hydroperoxide resistance regulator